MRQTATNLKAAQDRAARTVESPTCASCDSHSSELVFGKDPDGFVLCRECRSPLFYCDIGGQG